MLKKSILISKTYYKIKIQRISVRVKCIFKPLSPLHEVDLYYKIKVE
jgi:hypothetical protein